MMASRKIFSAQEQQIVALYQAGLSQTEIARQFDIDQTKVSVIVRSAGVSRGKGRTRNVTAIAPIAPAPTVVSPEVQYLQSIEADSNLDAAVRLEAAVRLRQIEAQIQYPQAPQYRPSSGVPMDSDFLPDYFADCSLDPATPKTAPVKPPVKPWEPNADEQETLNWAEQETIYGE